MEAKLDAILSSVEALNFKISGLESKIDFRFGVMKRWSYLRKM